MARNKKHRTVEQSFAFGGGVVGLLTFLAIGLLPALLYGGYAGVLLATGIFGEPIHTNMLAQAIVIFGIIVGALATAGVFVFLGAALGTGVCFLLGGVKRSEATQEQAAASSSSANKDA